MIIIVNNVKALVTKMEISKNKKLLVCACTNGLAIYDINDNAN
jgi:hypothetical protein